MQPLDSTAARCKSLAVATPLIFANLKHHVTNWLSRLLSLPLSRARFLASWSWSWSQLLQSPGCGCGLLAGTAESQAGPDAKEKQCYFLKKKTEKKMCLIMCLYQVYITSQKRELRGLDTSNRLFCWILDTALQ